MSAVLAEGKLKELEELFGFSIDEIASATGAAASTVYARKSPDAPQRSKMDSRLDDLYFLARYLLELGADAQTARGWVTSRSMHLRGAIPLDVLREDGPQPVLDAALAYSQGIPASEFLFDGEKAVPLVLDRSRLRPTG